MSYQVAINRTSPTCFIFLIDQSGSMQEPIMGVQGNPSKADFVADSFNKMIQELILDAFRDDGVRRFYQIGAYGYGKEVVSLFDYLSEGEDLVWIDYLAETPRRVEIREKLESDGTGGVIKLRTNFPIWIESRAKGRTPMCEALAKTKDVLEKWVDSNPNSFPPTVIIVTDGEATDGDPVAIAQELKSLSTKDGEVLVFTSHVSSNPFSTSLICPDVEDTLPDQAARTLFQISSILPAPMVEMANDIYDAELNENARAFVYNADIAPLISLFDIGSGRPPRMRI